jgi:hypothetical protein
VKKALILSLSLAVLVAVLACVGCGRSSETSESCEQAYSELESLTKQLGGGGQSKLPERAEFLRTCAGLPEKVQQCTILSYSQEHRSECQEAKNGLSGEHRERLARLSGR